MKIAILLPDLRGGGAERVMIDLGRQFSVYGHSIEFVLMRATGEFLHDALNFSDVFDLGSCRARSVPTKLSTYLRGANADLLIANMWPLTSAAVLARAMSRQSIKLLLVEHTTLSMQYATWGELHFAAMRASMMATYRFADRVAAVSQGAAIDTAKLARLGSEQVHVLHNPIPQRESPSLEALRGVEAIWDCPPGNRILAVGNLKEQKNHALLLQAFASLRDPSAKLLLLGKGENETGLRSLAFRLGITDRVIFAGFHADPSPFYASADLFALSSDYEGLPTVLIEALSFGLPVVSTDCPSGPREILGDGRWGRLVPTGDATSLARAMDEALVSPADPAELKARAADFAPEIAAERYLTFMGLT